MWSSANMIKGQSITEDYDENSEIWLKPFSVLLNLMFPAEYIYGEWYWWKGVEDATRRNPKLLTSSPANKIASGSKTEGFCIPQFYLAKSDKNPYRENLMEKEHWQPDSDAMFEKSCLFQDSKGNSFAMFTVNTEADDPRYVKLELTQEWKNEFVQYKSSTFLNHAFIFPTADHAIVDRAKKANDPKWSYEVHGPVRKLQQEGFIGYEEDQAGVFKYPTAWPEHAMEWIVRNRTYSWPSADLIQEIIESGCHIAPVGRGIRKKDPVDLFNYVRNPENAEPTSSCNKVDMDETEWRISFSVAENKLAASVSPVQRHVMVLLKMIKKLYFEGLISTYHLKNLLFWECESKDSKFWHQDNSASALLYMLGRLSTCLKERKLPHYMIPESNILQYEDPEMLDKAAYIVDDVRKNLLSKVVSMLMRLQSFTYLTNIYHSNLNLGNILMKIQNGNLSDTGKTELIYSICELFASKCKSVINAFIKNQDENSKKLFVVPGNAYISILARIACKEWEMDERNDFKDPGKLTEFALRKITDFPELMDYTTTSLEYFAQISEGKDPSLVIPSTKAMRNVLDMQMTLANENFQEINLPVKDTLGWLNSDDLKAIEKKLTEKFKGTSATKTRKDIEEEFNKELEKLFIERRQEADNTKHSKL